MLRAGADAFFVSSRVARRSYRERSQVAKLGFVSAVIAAYLIGYAIGGYAGLVDVRGELFSVLLAAVPSFLAYRMAQLWRSMNPVLTARSGVQALAFGRRPGPTGRIGSLLMATVELEGIGLYKAALSGPRPVRLIPYREIRDVTLDAKEMEGTIRALCCDSDLEIVGVRLDQATYFQAAAKARLAAPRDPQPAS